jgi:hypothetical protein
MVSRTPRNEVISISLDLHRTERAPVVENGIFAMWLDEFKVVELAAATRDLKQRGEPKRCDKGDNTIERRGRRFMMSLNVCRGGVNL